MPMALTTESRALKKTVERVPFSMNSFVAFLFKKAHDTHHETPVFKDILWL
jgi:hypothetical protein